MSVRTNNASHGGTWAVALPVLAALLLVGALAVQAMRAVQVHRRAVDTAVRDYAAFAAWQYTRRASDYLRLTIGSRLWAGRASGAPFGVSAECAQGSTASCPPARRDDGVAVGVVRDSRVILTRNGTGIPTMVIRTALDTAVPRARHSGMRIGLALVADGGTDGMRLIGYVIDGEDAKPMTIIAGVVPGSVLTSVLDHVATFAPLLPPSVTGGSANANVVSVRVHSASGALLASIGPDVRGIAAEDLLGPDLAGIRVVATLHATAIDRLVVGRLPPSNSWQLIGMLVMTLGLAVLAVLQVRRMHDLARVRNDFVAGVSHELKTPLTQISLFAETLASRDRSAAERQQYLTIITREARRLSQLVDGVLHFAGMLRGTTVSGSRETAILGEEIRAAVAAFEPIARARDVSIDVRVAGDVEVPLERDAFRQLLLNLLDNALKFGPDAQRITIEARRDGAAAIVTVSDEGPGVPVPDRARIFDAFARGDTRSAGSGIGLAVVRDVARRHGGDVRVLDTPAGGACFEIRLAGASAVTVLERAPS